VIVRLADDQIASYRREWYVLLGPARNDGCGPTTHTARRLPDGGITMIESLGAVLPHAATRFGDKTALVSGGRSFSFRELDDLSGPACVVRR
jgi:hypothetical protein